MKDNIQLKLHNGYIITEMVEISLQIASHQLNLLHGYSNTNNYLHYYNNYFMVNVIYLQKFLKVE